MSGAYLAEQPPSGSAIEMQIARIGKSEQAVAQYRHCGIRPGLGADLSHSK